MSNKQPKIVIILGRSGCGKGTQAKLLIKDFGFNYLSSGDLLRERSNKIDFSGKKLKQVMNKGGLVSTPIMFRIWSEKIEKMKNKIDKKGLIIDGSPRSLPEAKLMNGVFEWYEWSDIKVILLDISEQDAFDRLTKRRICKKCGHLIPWVGYFKKIKECDKCGGELITRFDDKPEAIKARLNFYKKDVEPAIEYYKEQSILNVINGDNSIEEVYQDILKVFKK
ncbi:nucleoside monophosphate kinase [Patescibacteria group bacterium]|nr:nucleoside monophosphate kinase [Patescibacteria group bacterium]